MPLRMPLLSGRRSAAIAKIIRRVAAKRQMTDYEVALVMADVFEGIIGDVAMGLPVTVPGFGMFAAVRWEPRVRDVAPYAAPRFAPSHVFRQDVRATCSSCPASAEDFARFCRQSHVTHYGKENGKAQRARAITFFRRFRENVRAQARKEGRDV